MPGKIAFPVFTPRKKVATVKSNVTSNNMYLSHNKRHFLVIIVLKKIEKNSTYQKLLKMITFNARYTLKATVCVNLCI